MVLDEEPSGDGGDALLLYVLLLNGLRARTCGTTWNFVVPKGTPMLELELGYQLLVMFGATSIRRMTVFLWVHFLLYSISPASLARSLALAVAAIRYSSRVISFYSILPETKGRSLEEMDIFGAVSAPSSRRRTSPRRFKPILCRSRVSLSWSCSAWDRVGVYGLVHGILNLLLVLHFICNVAS